MSITDELRDYADMLVGVWNEDCKKLRAIADRIDAEHERELLSLRNLAWNNGYDEGFASADDWLAQNEGAMAEHGWVRLPKDADGEIIHAGDEMEWLNGLKRGRVTAIGVGEREGWVWVLMDGKNVSIANLASDLHHYKQPTVEDVLREMLLKAHVYTDDELCMVDDLAADYAKRMRLAGDGE